MAATTRNGKMLLKWVLVSNDQREYVGNESGIVVENDYEHEVFVDIGEL